MNRRSSLIVAAGVMLCLGVLYGRALWEGRTALSTGDRSFKNGQIEEAIFQWRRAARWYAPLAPHVEPAYDRMRKVARSTNESGDRESALLAWRGIRSSVRATRSLYTPYRQRGEEADEAIAALMAAEDAERGIGSETQRKGWHAALLAKDHLPSRGWSLLALVGLALWVGSGFAFALRAVDEEGRWVGKAAGYSGAGVIAGLLLWALSLYSA